MHGALGLRFSTHHDLREEPFQFRVAAGAAHRWRIGGTDERFELSPARGAAEVVKGQCSATPSPLRLIFDPGYGVWLRLRDARTFGISQHAVVAAAVKARPPIVGHAFG